MRYLIVKTSAFGDIIHAYPVLQYLKQLDPACEIDWVVEKRMKELVQGHPHVNRLVVLDTHTWRSGLHLGQMIAFCKELRSVQYDALFDLQANWKSSIITLLARAKDKVGFGFKTAHEPISAISYTHRYNMSPEIGVQAESLFLLESYFGKKQTLKPSPLLITNDPIPALKATWLVAPGSNWKNKQLTPETLLAFLQLCKAHYSPTFAFLCGNDQERATSQALCEQFPGSEILFRPSLSVLQHIMAKMQLVLSMDSLPLHLAATANCKTFSFFGPSSSQKYKPLGPQHGSFQGPCPYGMTFGRRCPKLRTCPTGACLRQVSPEALFRTFQDWYHIH